MHKLIFSLVRFAIAWVVMFQLSAFAWGQDTQRYVCLTLESGVVRCGYMTLDDGREITLETPDLGKLIVPKVQVIKVMDAPVGTLGASSSGNMELSDRMVQEDRSLQATRYFFAPSAHSLKQGEGYGSFSLLTGGNLSYGLGEQTIGGLSASWLGYGINLKHSVEIDDATRLSFGGLAQVSWLGTSGQSGSGYVYFPFVNATKGSENDHVTVGFGYLGGQRAYTEFDIYEGLIQREEPIQSPMVNVSGCLQLGTRSWLLTENYYFFNPEFFPVNQVYSIGIRVWNSRKGRLNEYAVVGLLESDGTLRGLPWLSWTWPF